jgi:phage terminase small subunit
VGDLLFLKEKNNMENGEAPKIIEAKLSPKQKKFADLYIGKCNLNGTRAAIAAGYSEKSAREIACQNLTKLNIRRYIDSQLNTGVLSASEVLLILSRQAKGSVTDVLDEDGNFNLKTAEERGTDRLIKKLKITEKLDAEGHAIERTYDYEIHDPQAAAEKVGKFHKLFTDKKEHSGTITTYAMSKEEWEAEAAKKLDKVNEQLDKFDDDERNNSEDTDPDA